MMGQPVAKIYTKALEGLINHIDQQSKELFLKTMFQGVCKT